MFPKYLKNFHNSVAKCCVTQFKLRSGTWADIFPVTADEGPAAYEMIFNIHVRKAQSKGSNRHLTIANMEKFNPWTQRNQKDSNCHLTIANMEKFELMNSAGVQIATTPESNTEEISLQN